MMKLSKLKSKKGQLKIQEMAFVLIAIMIFFALVGLLFVKFRVGSLEQSAESSKERVAGNLVLVLSSTPELSWAECAGCIDMDKAILIKNKSEYRNLWKVDYLVIKSLYPEKTNKECSLGNYPDCNSLTLVNSSNFGISSKAFVSLCRFDFIKERKVCELGELYASGGGIKSG